jgi:hypothetical protein
MDIVLSRWSLKARQYNTAQHCFLKFCHLAVVTGYIKLALDAGKASPAPPVGPALGSKVPLWCPTLQCKYAFKHVTHCHTVLRLLEVTVG